MQDFGAAVLIGGMSRIGQPACDVWALDVDMVLNFVENPKKFKKENVWIRKDINKEDEQLVCRWAHTTGVIDNRNIIIFGGIDSKLNAIRFISAYDFLDHKFVQL